MDTERSLYEEAKLNPEMKMMDFLKQRLGMIDADVEALARKVNLDLSKPAGTLRRVKARDIMAAIK
jgi:hypothetical protein